MKHLAAYVVDAFTQEPFSGNPAAVCVLSEPKSEKWMQAAAAEFNLSETAFIYQLETDLWDLRWFTPQCEVNLCGHATLASVHVIANELLIPRTTYRFSTRSGELRANSLDEGFQLDFPRIEVQALASANFEALLGRHHQGLYAAGEDFLMVLDDEQAVAQYHPNLPAIKQLLCRGLIVTAPGAKGVDFVSRFFAPAFGIDEDPVTGSAHCSLGDFWSKQLNKNRLTARQISARGGSLVVEVKEQRVLLEGSAITSIRCQLLF